MQVASSRLSDPEEDEPTGFERFLARGVPVWAVMLIIIVAIGTTIGLLALNKAPEKHGAVGVFVRQIADIPDTIGDWWKGPVPYYGGTYEKLAAGFTRNTQQPLVDTGYALITPYDPVRKRASVQLMRLSDGKIVHEWLPDVDALNRQSTFRSAIVDVHKDRTVAKMRPMHPMLLADGSILIHDNTPLSRIDACNRATWMIDGIFHHSLQRAADGSLWIPSRAARSAAPNTSARFADEALTHVTDSGKVLSVTRLIDIFDRNALGGLWRGRPYTDDPFHINDIEPVTTNGPYWQAGDLFLSLRNMSMVALYRPSTGRIVWWHSGPWAAQHDVSILDDHRISVFDNNVPAAYPRARVDGRSRMLVYDFATKRVSDPYAVAFTKHDIATLTQGRGTPLQNGDVMVEETERGRLMRVAPDGTLRWQYISADADQRRLWLSWSRYLDGNSADVRSALSALGNTRCGATT